MYFFLEGWHMTAIDHRHISRKVPNIEFDFDVWFFDINAMKGQTLKSMSPYYSVQMRPTLSYPNLTFKHIHRSRIRRLVLSVACVQKAADQSQCK